MMGCRFLLPRLSLLLLSRMLRCCLHPLRIGLSLLLPSRADVLSTTAAAHGPRASRCSAARLACYRWPLASWPPALVNKRLPALRCCLPVVVCLLLLPRLPLPLLPRMLRCCRRPLMVGVSLLLSSLIVILILLSVLFRTPLPLPGLYLLLLMLLHLHMHLLLHL